METSNTALKVKTLKERCWGIIQYGLANRSSHAPASYVVQLQLALTMHSAFEEVEDNWQQMSRRQATDHLLRVRGAVWGVWLVGGVGQIPKRYRK